MKNKDILLIARPDHSLQIYDVLRQQKELSYTFLTFKVVPDWIKRLLFNWNRLRGVGKNVVISLRCTLVNLLRFKYKLAIAQKISEENLMGRDIRAMLRGCSYKIIHYWPLYSYKEVEAWAQRHPETLVMADVHFPNPETVIKEMLPVYEKYGLQISDTVWPRHLDSTNRLLRGAPSFMVPSVYVANSYKEAFPEKKMYVVTYGLSVYRKYKPVFRNSISSFVFAGGTISLEKGCDILCDYFSKNPKLSLHLYGDCMSGQEFIFLKYKQFNNIYFHGHIPKAELQDTLIKYDVGIHLSRFDAYSLSVGEILGCGIPVVVSDKTGISAEVSMYGLGVVTDLYEEAISDSINSVCDVGTYNTYVKNIDKYIHTIHKPYGEKMLDFYREHC